MNKVRAIARFGALASLVAVPACSSGDEPDSGAGVDDDQCARAPGC